MQTIIFANGAINPKDRILESIHEDDLIIAADGGARHCKTLGIQPHIAIGDFDSLDEKEITSLASGGTLILRYPERKDYTDLELAIQHASKSGSSRVLIFGALGLRWDQTLANILLPTAYPNLTISLVDGNQEIFFITNHRPGLLSGRQGDIVSLIPIQGDAVGITTSGLEYPLKNETLFFGASRGVSNVLAAETAQVRLTQGILLCTMIHR
jgi:thiamine pyrophosphokinase